jgi:hypothetical protein
VDEFRAVTPSKKSARRNRTSDTRFRRPLLSLSGVIHEPALRSSWWHLEIDRSSQRVSQQLSRFRVLVQHLVKEPTAPSSTRRYSGDMLEGR